MKDSTPDKSLLDILAEIDNVKLPDAWINEEVKAPNTICRNEAKAVVEFLVMKYSLLPNHVRPSKVDGICLYYPTPLVGDKNMLVEVDNDGDKQVVVRLDRDVADIEDGELVYRRDHKVAYISSVEGLDFSKAVEAYLRSPYMKAYELAQILLDHPTMKVGIRKFGGDNKWPINKVTVDQYENTDSTLLISSENYDNFILLEAIDTGSEEEIDKENNDEQDG